jgi:hypothetical protein
MKRAAFILFAHVNKHGVHKKKNTALKTPGKGNMIKKTTNSFVHWLRKQTHQGDIGGPCRRYMTSTSAENTKEPKGEKKRIEKPLKHYNMMV